MYKTLRIIHANNFLFDNFVRKSSQNASIKSKKIGLVGMGNVGNVLMLKKIKTTILKLNENIFYF